MSELVKGEIYCVSCGENFIQPKGECLNDYPLRTRTNKFNFVPVSLFRIIRKHQNVVILKFKTYFPFIRYSTLRLKTVFKTVFKE